VKIIRRKDNWQELFNRVFRDEEAISVKLRELEPIRNAIAHFRPLSAEMSEKLRIIAGEIVKAIEAAS
jgi:hypothetical protein